MSVNTEAIRARLAEYDPDAPRCTKTVAESRNYAPDSMGQNDLEWDTYTVTHYVPCCRPKGHDGECRNSRRVLGWPGRATIIALLDEVEDLRGKVNKPRAYLDDLLARVERGARAAERKMVIAWLAEPCGTWDHAPRCATCSYKARLAFDIRDGLHLPAPSPNTDGGGGA